MVDLRFERVTALPEATRPNTIYFVRAPGTNYALQFISGNDGIAIPVGGNPTPTPSPPQKVGDLPHRNYTVGSGPQTFGIASGFSGSGLTYSVVSAPANADYTINAATGAITAQTVVESLGDMVVRATNAAGFAEQTFPYFIRAEPTFTVLERDPNGTGVVTVESLEEIAPLTIERNPDGTVTVKETA